MKKNSCTPINPKKYSCNGLNKIHAKNLITKKILAARKFPSPHNFSNGPSLNTEYSNLQCQMSKNCETLVKPRSRYSRETSEKFFSPNWKCTQYNARDTRQSLLWESPRKVASLEADLQDRRGKMFEALY